MFRGHWLVADVDGTLLPTPTKAGGTYMSFTDSLAAFAHRSGRAYLSCLPALRTFLRAGGSLCVVSTAGVRLWQQVYVDLAPALFPPVAAGQGPAQAPGRLLICGFTGAALFRSVDPRALVTERVVGCVSQLPPQTQAAPPASHGLEEWGEYRTTEATTLSDAAQRAAAVEGRAAIIRFFEHVSAVCGHDVSRAAAFFRECLSRKYHRVYTAMLAEMLAETRLARGGGAPAPGEPICFADTSTMAMDRLTRHGEFLVETADALVDCQRVPRADGTVHEEAPVAQVVIMGIPARYFDVIFPSSSSTSTTTTGGPALQCCPACLARATHHRDGSTAGLSQLTAPPLSLAVKRQPNSVCIHRAGVDKGTCVRWLMAHAGELDAGAAGFSLERALSFGDVPATVDRPLAEFPPMQMISLSPLPHDGCATPEEQSALMARGMVHVGGEEEGSALFLKALIEDCEREARVRGCDAREGCVEGGTWFTKERVEACAAKAREGLASP